MGRLGNRYSPTSPDLTCCLYPVPACSTITVAPGITAPVFSSTVPLSRAVVYWAGAVVAHMTVNNSDEKRKAALPCARLKSRHPAFRLLSVGLICAVLHSSVVRLAL